MSEGTGKLPLRRLEQPIHKFTKVVIPTDLQRLQQHQHNIEKVRTYIHNLSNSLTDLNMHTREVYCEQTT